MLPEWRRHTIIFGKQSGRCYLPSPHNGEYPVLCWQTRHRAVLLLLLEKFLCNPTANGYSGVFVCMGRITGGTLRGLLLSRRSMEPYPSSDNNAHILGHAIHTHTHTHIYIYIL